MDIDTFKKINLKNRLYALRVQYPTYDIEYFIANDCTRPDINNTLLISTRTFHSWSFLDGCNQLSFFKEPRPSIYIGEISFGDVTIRGRKELGSTLEPRAGEVWMTFTHQPCFIFESVNTKRVHALNLNTGYWSDRPLRERGISNIQVSIKIEPKLIEKVQ